MDGNLSAAELYAHLGTALAPMLVDVRRQDAFDADDRQIIGALRHAPGEVDRWSRGDRPHFDIKDPALDRVATVVRGADASRRDLAPEREGLYAISFGLSANFPDDHEMLRHGLVMYDALYTWCRKTLP